MKHFFTDELNTLNKGCSPKEKDIYHSHKDADLAKGDRERDTKHRNLRKSRRAIYLWTCIILIILLCIIYLY